MRRKWADMLLQDDLPMPAGALVGHKKASTRAQSKESEVWVPLLQSLVSGGLLLAALLVEAGLFALLPFKAWLVSSAAMLTIFGLVIFLWFWFLRNNRPLLWQHESVFNAETQAEPADKQRQVWHVKGAYQQRNDGGYERWSLYDLPCPAPAYMQQFAQAILVGDETFSERSANKYGFGIKSDNADPGSTRTVWEDFRDEFERRGWARWRHPGSPQQGIELTPEGEDIIQDIATGELP